MCQELFSELVKRRSPWEGSSVPCVGLSGVCCDLHGTVVGSTGPLELLVAMTTCSAMFPGAGPVKTLYELEQMTRNQGA